MFNPQPEPPGDVWMGFGTTANGPYFEMTVPEVAGGGGLQIADPMLNINADSEGPEIALQREFVSPSGARDSTRIFLAVNAEMVLLDMFGPNSANIPSIRLINNSSGPAIGIGTTPTNILTVQRFSATDPVADAWTIYSSRRWKNNIKTITDPLVKVMALRGVTFKWKENSKKDIGLIAEEVGLVLPEIVEYEENGVDAKSVDYARLVALLIEGMKDQQKSIQKMQGQIDELTRAFETLAESKGNGSTRYANSKSK